MLRLLAVVSVCAMLAACSPQAPSATTATNSATPAPSATNVLAGTPLAAYGHDLNRAKNVQNVIDDAAKRQAAAVDAATGSSSGN